MNKQLQMKQMIIPNQFQAKQNKIKHKMKLISNDEKFGSIKRKKVDGGVTFELLDVAKNPVAIARKKYFDFGSVIEVYDMFGGLMGTVEHRIQNPMTQPIQKYILFDGYGKSMAESRQQNDIDSKLILYSRDNRKVFSMSKSHNFLKDNWSVEINQPIDKRLAIFLPMFVTSQLGKQMY